MKKSIALICCGLFLSLNLAHAQKTTLKQTAPKKEEVMPSIFDFSMKDINGKDFSFKDLKGKKILIVNTASQCGYTPQYQELEDLHRKYGDIVTVIGFPANNFGGQEPGTNKEIAQFCSKNYGVTFPMMQKISVDGKDISPVYEFLTLKSKNGVMDSAVEWNFQKYLINEEGKLIKVFPSKVKPLSPEIVDAITAK